MIVAMAFALVSCGGGEKKAKPSILKPEKTEVKGKLSEYFTVVDKSYEISAMEKNVLREPIVSVLLQRTETPLPAAYKHGYEPVGTFGQGVDGNYGFGIKIKDANDNEVFSARADKGGMSGVYSSDDLKELWELNAGETSKVRWSVEKLKDAKGEYKFEITSYVNPEAGNYSSKKSSKSSKGDFDLGYAKDAYNAAEKYAKDTYQAAEAAAADAMAAAEAAAASAYGF